MHAIPTLARLDRFLVSAEWDHKFPLTSVEALPRITSDYCPILLIAKNCSRGKNKIFRFEEAWQNHEGFISKLPDWWREGSQGTQNKSTVLSFTAKLRHYRIRIKKWCAKEFYGMRRVKNRLMDEIQRIDIAKEHGDLPHDLDLRRGELKDNLRKVLSDEAALWRTRAKQHWLREGDGNTRFFHFVANGRRRANWIGTAAKNGVRYHSEEDKQSYFYQYFKVLFSPEESDPGSFGDWSMLFQSSRVAASELSKLTETFNLDEIKVAVFQLGGDKTSGPDRFPLRFYQTFWDTVKTDILNLFHEMYEGKLSTSPINYAFICLIPKKEGAIRVNDFRPINLLNGI